ncbi:hypothetical protein, partial [Nocardia cyriacigeorgica]|uniref:hypothetical protein n=1 Tax=Nocardia cyriacigeorgica TaxID=135487 RepID=UPI001C49B978
MKPRSAIGEHWMVTFGGSEAGSRSSFWTVTALALLLGFRKSRNVSHRPTRPDRSPREIGPADMAPNPACHPARQAEPES